MGGLSGSHWASRACAATPSCPHRHPLAFSTVRDSSPSSPHPLPRSHPIRGRPFRGVLRVRGSPWQLELGGGPRQETSPGFPPAPGFWHVIKRPGFLCFMSSESTGRCWFNQFGCLLSLATVADGGAEPQRPGSPRESDRGRGPPGWPGWPGTGTLLPDCLQSLSHSGARPRITIYTATSGETGEAGWENPSVQSGWVLRITANNYSRRQQASAPGTSHTRFGLCYETHTGLGGGS